MKIELSNEQRSLLLDALNFFIEHHVTDDRLFELGDKLHFKGYKPE